MDAPQQVSFPRQSVEAWHGIEQDITPDFVRPDNAHPAIREVIIDPVDEDSPAHPAVASREAKGIFKPEGMSDMAWQVACQEVAEAAWRVS